MMMLLPLYIKGTRLSDDPKGPGYWEGVIMRVDASQIPQTTMTEQQPIIVPSRSPSPELSSYSTPATSHESSSSGDFECPIRTEWPDSEALPYQEKIDSWLASD